MVDSEVLISAIFVLFLPAYGYLLTINGKLGGLIEKVNGHETRITHLERFKKWQS